MNTISSDYVETAHHSLLLIAVVTWSKKSTQNDPIFIETKTKTIKNLPDKVAEVRTPVQRFLALTALEEYKICHPDSVF